MRGCFFICNSWISYTALYATSSTVGQSVRKARKKIMIYFLGQGFFRSRHWMMSPNFEVASNRVQLQYMVKWYDNKTINTGKCWSLLGLWNFLRRERTIDELELRRQIKYTLIKLALNVHQPRRPCSSSSLVYQILVPPLGHFPNRPHPF